MLNLCELVIRVQYIIFVFLFYSQDELEKKYVGLVMSYGHDLKTVQELFLLHRDNCPIAWNLPPIAGALTWCRGLVER